MKLCLFFVLETLKFHSKCLSCVQTAGESNSNQIPFQVRSLGLTVHAAKLHFGWQSEDSFCLLSFAGVQECQ